MNKEILIWFVLSGEDRSIRGVYTSKEAAEKRRDFIGEREFPPHDRIVFVLGPYALDDALFVPTQ